VVKTGPSVTASGLWWRDARIALCGGIAATAMAAGGAASLGQFGASVASQTLLANGAVHMAAVSGVLCVILVGLGWRVVGGIGIILAAAVASVTFARVGWTAVAAVEGAQPRLEVLHFNVLDNNRRPNELIAALRASGAEVIVLLEATGVGERLTELGDLYPHRFGCTGGGCEIAILSKLPLEKPQWIDFPFATQRLATAMVRPEGRAIRLVAAHFTKDFFANIRDAQGWRLISQVRRLRRLEPMPLLVTGDFNAAPWDPVVKNVARQIGLRHPWAWLPTWPVAAGPFGVQIDHVLVSPELAVERIATTADALGSNHRGLRATVAFRP
jgi:endonuclease/exonuclease/phosphatase (EEP) superfamily protein YafD